MNKTLLARFRRAVECAYQRQPQDAPNQILNDFAQKFPDLWTEVAHFLAYQEGMKAITRFQKMGPVSFRLVDESRQLKLFE